LIGEKWWRMIAPLNPISLCSSYILIEHSANISTLNLPKKENQI
jgi:hypothetical protein